MIRSLALLSALLFAQQGQAAPIATSGAAPPALIQCLSAALTANPDDKSGPVITDCVSTGSNACRNTQTNPSNTAIVGCDREEQAFWEALLTYEVTTLQKSLKPDGVGSLRRSQKVWLTWRAARCDFIQATEKGTKQVDVDVSFCLMESTALRAIDLMYAL